MLLRKQIVGSVVSKNINTNGFFKNKSVTKFKAIIPNLSNSNLDRWVKQELSTSFRIKSNSLRYSPSQSIKIKALKIDQYILWNNY